MDKELEDKLRKVAEDWIKNKPKLDKVEFECEAPTAFYDSLSIEEKWEFEEEYRDACREEQYKEGHIRSSLAIKEGIISKFKKRKEKGE